MALFELAAAAALLGRGRVRFCCDDSFSPTQQPVWQQATILYAPSSCFDPEMMQSVAAYCTSLSPGTVVITTTQRLPRVNDGRAPTPTSEQSLSYAKGRITFYCYVVSPKWQVSHKAERKNKRKKEREDVKAHKKQQRKKEK